MDYSFKKCVTNEKRNDTIWGDEAGLTDIFLEREGLHIVVGWEKKYARK